MIAPKKKNRRSHSFRCMLLACFCLFSGCQLEDPAYRDYVLDGALIECPDVNFIYFKDGTVITANNPNYMDVDYQPAFTFGMCPTSSPSCIAHPDGYSLCSPCEAEQQLCYGRCLVYASTNILACDDVDNKTITCIDGYADCDGDVNNGCEFNLLTNHALSCVGKKVTCVSDYADCDANYKTGCEFQLSVHHAISCTDKTVLCQSSYGDCNEYYIDGCETNLNNTIEHCGACTIYARDNEGNFTQEALENHACEAGKICNGLGECTDSCKIGSILCGFTCVDTMLNHIDVEAGGCETTTDENGNTTTHIVCVEDYTNCDNNPENGCEYRLSANNAVSCENEQLTCDLGYSNCDGDYLNGCEFSLVNGHALSCDLDVDDDGSTRFVLSCAAD